MAVEQEKRQQAIVVEPETTLADILDLAYDKPMVLERNGIRYHVSRDPLTRANPPDPEEFRAMLRCTAGAFAGIDREAYRRDLRFWRGYDGDDEEQ